MAVIFCYALIFSLWISSSWGHADLSIECKRLRFVPSAFSSSAKDDPRNDLRNLALNCTIPDSKDYVSVDFLEDIVFSRNRTVCQLNNTCDVDVYLHCENSNTTINFDRTSNQGTNILGGIRIRNCVLGWDDLNLLGTKIQLRLVESVIDDHSPTIIPVTNSTELIGLQNLTELHLTFDQMTKRIYIHDLLPIQEVMPVMSVLTLHCYLPVNENRFNQTQCKPGQIIFDPERLNGSFPNLQSFAVKHVYPESGYMVNFPWFPHKLPIPNGLYRSYYYRHLSYYSSEDLNYTRRIFSVQHIDNLKPEVICPIRNEMNEVIIRNCELYSVPGDCLHDTKNLKFLDISFNPLTSINELLLKNQTQLVKLYISHTNITAFPNGTFSDLENLNLLVISNNKLKHLQEHLFLNLKNLETLSAHNNMISTIDHHTLPIGSRRLSYVDLQHNQLTLVPYDCHLILTEKLMCNCDHNSISLGNVTAILRSFDPIMANMAKPFAYYGQIPGILHQSNLHQVEFAVMSLQDNNVTNVDVQNYFTPNHTKEWATDALAAIFSFARVLLETVDPTKMLLCDCALYRFREFVLYQMDSLVSKYLYANFVLPNKASTFNWVCRPYSILQGTQTQIINFGHFLDMAPSMFICELPDHGKLDCPFNCTCFIRDHIEPTILVDCSNRSFVTMPKFSAANVPYNYSLEINFAHNLIEKFPECGSHGYTWLSVVTSLNIGENRQGGGRVNPADLERFLHCMPKVRKLFLGQTGFESLPMSIMKNLAKNLTVIEIPNDTLRCDCHSYWLKEWLQSLAGKVINKQPIFCVGKEYPVVQMERDDFVCEGIAYYWPYIMMITAILLLVVILLSFAYFYRFEIGVLIFEKLNWHPFHRQEEEQSKKYDAYLMYSDHDYKWAQNTLLKGLEKCRYRIVDPLRDSITGRGTEEETAEFLQQSHRVILVLSQKLLSDKSVISDFYRAESQGKAYGNKRFIIMVVMHDKINFDDHPVFLRYINTNYFIMATCKRFWSRLFYWLPQTQLSDVLPDAGDNLPQYERTSPNLRGSSSSGRALVESDPDDRSNEEFCESMPLLRT